MSRRHSSRIAMVATSVLLAAATATAQSFDRVSSFPTALNLDADAGGADTSAASIAVADDGATLAYADRRLGAIGFIDLSDPEHPLPGGRFAVDGAPTSVAIAGETMLASVDGDRAASTGGFLLATSLDGRVERTRCDFGGRIVSFSLAPDGAFVAIAIEEPRDVGEPGAAGRVVLVPLSDGVPICGGGVRADLSAAAPIDARPTFVDVNADGSIAVALGFSGHIVILDPDGGVVAQFPTGAAVTASPDDASGQEAGRPGAVVRWLDEDRLVVSRGGSGVGGFAIVRRDGETLFESGAELDAAAAAAGHDRIDAPAAGGSAPTDLAVARIGDSHYVFVPLRGAALVAVYRDGPSAPELIQLLPSGAVPATSIAIPSRDVLIATTVSHPIDGGGLGAHVMVYALGDEPPSYPSMVAVDADGGPIGWSGFSGLAADPERPGRLFAVAGGSFDRPSAIYEIDATQVPARILRRAPITRDGAPAQLGAVSGVASDGAGGFWIASDADVEAGLRRALHHIDADGVIDQTVPFPDALSEVVSAAPIGFGAAGLALAGDTLWIAVGGGEGDGSDGRSALLASYGIDTAEWRAVRLPLDETERGRVGVSAMAAFGDHLYVVVRDDQIGGLAEVKRLYRLPLDQLIPGPLTGETPVASPEFAYDFLPDLAAPMGFIVERVDGFAVDADGEAYAVAGAGGDRETHFLRLEFGE